MIKIFESFDMLEVGRVRSLLEANGIQTFVKNEFLSGALGELPFQEVAPQLYIVNEQDLPETNRLLPAKRRLGRCIHQHHKGGNVADPNQKMPHLSR